jgi:two-component system, LuxR family, response regulator FixJ
MPADPRLKPTVFVIDADRVSREVVAATAKVLALPCEGYGSIRKFLKDYDASRPGCLVAEPHASELGGLPLQQYLRKYGVTLPVILLTSHVELSIAVEAMRQGAVHYLQKPPAKIELLKALDEAVEIDREHRMIRERTRGIGARVARLTPKEQEVLRLLGQGRSNREIAKAMGVGIRAVQAHRRRLFRQLGVESLTELMDLALLCHAQQFLELLEEGQRPGRPADVLGAAGLGGASKTSTRPGRSGIGPGEDGVGVEWMEGGAPQWPFDDPG